MKTSPFKQPKPIIKRRKNPEGKYSHFNTQDLLKFIKQSAHSTHRGDLDMLLELFLDRYNARQEELDKLNEDLAERIQIEVNLSKANHKRYEQQAKMAAMGEMMDAVAHQWKQPLSIIKLSTSEVQYMQDEGLITPSYIEEVNARIEKQVDHLVETIDEFRGFFRPKTNIELISIKTVIDSALLLVKDELIKNTIDIKFIGDKTIEAKIIPNEFKHAIINLVNNSKDAFNDGNICDESDFTLCHENRIIIFEFNKTIDNIILKITDNAGGIPDTIIKNIFEVNVTSKEEGKGTGIGLYMTKNIIEKIGATIDVENVELINQNGKSFIGACFKVVIPCK